MSEQSDRGFADLDLVLAKIAHERELREVLATELQKALDIQATETLRRLDELNHAHAQAMENWRTSLPRELFEAWKEEHTKWKETVTAALASVASINERLSHVDGRVVSIEKLANKMSGALILLSAMGVAGVIALLLGIARLAGVGP